MAHGSPADVAADWSSKLSGSTEKVRRGVEAVSVAPGEKAAQAADLWIRRVQESRTKWADRVRSVSLGDWKQAMTEKGLARIASGAQAAQPKMERFLAEFLPHVDAVAQRVRAMPKGSIEESIARAAAQIRGNATFKRSGR